MAESSAGPDPDFIRALTVMAPEEARRALFKLAPEIHPFLRGIAASVLTGAHSSPDAALIIAEYLREHAHEAPDHVAHMVPSLEALADVLTAAAAYLPGGAKAVQP